MVALRIVHYRRAAVQDKDHYYKGADAGDEKRRCLLCGSHGFDGSPQAAFEEEGEDREERKDKDQEEPGIQRKYEYEPFAQCRKQYYPAEKIAGERPSVRRISVPETREEAIENQPRPYTYTRDEHIEECLI